MNEFFTKFYHFHHIFGSCLSFYKKQTTLGIVKGSSTVEVQEDGSLHVNSDRLESAIADKLGVIKQGRNTHITADGAINVDGISNVVTDNNFNDGAINDIRVQF